MSNILSLKEYIKKFNIRENKDCINKNGWFYEKIGDSLLKLSHYKKDLLHNDSGPAIICNDYIYDYCFIEHYNNSLCHRKDGPAKVVSTKEVFWNGESFIFSEDSKTQKEIWFFEGLRHNLKGPAEISYEKHDVKKQYYIDGIIFLEMIFKNHPKTIIFNNKLYIKNKMNNSF